MVWKISNQVGFLQCFRLLEVQRWIDESCHWWNAQDHYFSVAMGQGFRGHWNENAVEWSKYRAPAFVDLLVPNTVSLQSVVVALRSQIRYIPQVLKGLAITPPLVMPYPDQTSDAVREVSIWKLRSPLFVLHVMQMTQGMWAPCSWATRQCCATARSLWPTSLCGRLDIKRTQDVLCQASEMTCNVVGPWVSVRVIHYLVARMKKNGEQLKESPSQVLELW